jgi:hypothetical protein
MDTRPEGLSVIGDRVNFRSLSLEGVRGRVRATLTEKQVSFESKSGHALDIKLDAVKRVHHHHTTLVPGWLAASWFNSDVGRLERGYRKDASLTWCCRDCSCLPPLHHKKADTDYRYKCK